MSSPKSSKSFKQNKIELKFSSTPTAIIEIEERKRRKPRPKASGFFALSQINDDFANDIR
jgi:hypothetical protein